MPNIDDATDQATYDDAAVQCFGLLAPCDWAATLSAKLSQAAQTLEEAQKHLSDPAKDIAATTDEEALAQIRRAANCYLAEVYMMLHSMPLMQQQPKILGALQFIVASIEGIDRGSGPAWLAVRATKRHPKRLSEEAEWVPIIAALELLLIDHDVSSIDAAAKAINRRTGRAVGTIKDWHRRLFRKADKGREAAKAEIQLEIGQVRAALVALTQEDRKIIIERRVSELLK